MLTSSCSNDGKWDMYIESSLQLLSVGSLKRGQFNEVGNVKRNSDNISDLFRRNVRGVMTNDDCLVRNSKGLPRPVPVKLITQWCEKGSSGTIIQ